MLKVKFSCSQGFGEGQESIIGVRMCGLSESFLFAAVSRLVDREARASDTAITVAGDTTPRARVRGGPTVSIS